MTPWTVAHQARLSVGLYRQEHCSGLPLPSPISVVYEGKPHDFRIPHIHGAYASSIVVKKEKEKVVA